MAKDKEEAWSDWNDKMEAEEGEKMIYKVMKQRARAKQDIGKVVVIKDQNGKLLTEEMEIKGRWHEYFDHHLLNIENDREVLEECPQVEDQVQGASRRD